MKTSIPPYIEERIRRPMPSGSIAVAGSTPVVAFGDSQAAWVATLGLNPSNLEFLDHAGRELIDDARRLATHSSLGHSDLAAAPVELIGQVLADCNGYFGRRPYTGWFGHLESVLKQCNASYYDRTACHLDLVQWATATKWGKLQSAHRKQLVAEDSEFLGKQLRNEQLSLLLVNGQGVIDELERTFDASLKEVDRILGLAKFDCRLYDGVIFDSVRVIAWDKNLQSTHGMTTLLRDEIAKRIGTISRQLQ